MKLIKVFGILCVQFSMPSIQRKQKGGTKSLPFQAIAKCLLGKIKIGMYNSREKSTVCKLWGIRSTLPKDSLGAEEAFGKGLCKPMAHLNSKNQRRDLSRALLAYSDQGSGSATPHVTFGTYSMARPRQCWQRCYGCHWSYWRNSSRHL